MRTDRKALPYTHWEWHGISLLGFALKKQSLSVYSRLPWVSLLPRLSATPLRQPSQALVIVSINRNIQHLLVLFLLLNIVVGAEDRTHGFRNHALYQRARPQLLAHHLFN